MQVQQHIVQSLLLVLPTLLLSNMVLLLLLEGVMFKLPAGLLRCERYAA
jgi:hypothetical protein